MQTGGWGTGLIVIAVGATVIVGSGGCEDPGRTESPGLEPGVPPGGTGEESTEADGSTIAMPDGDDSPATSSGHGETTGDGASDSSGVAAVACGMIAAQWVDLGDGRIEVDFDGVGERVPTIFGCAEPSPGHVELAVNGEAFNVDLAATVGAVPIDSLVLLVATDAVIGSYSVEEPALTSGILPPGVALSIVNAGRIQGAGGEGGFGGVCGVPSTPGEHGGVGLELRVDAQISLVIESDGAEAIGQLWGGGGGGGGGGDGCDEVYCGGTGGGGGGAGSLPGPGGDAIHPTRLPSLSGGGTCGDAGGTNAPGDPGMADEGGTTQWNGTGGGPGLPGAAGHPGAPSFQTTGGQAGGAPGCSLVAIGVSVNVDAGDVRPAPTDEVCYAGPE